MRKQDWCECSKEFEKTFHEKAPNYMEIIWWELSLNIFKFEDLMISKFWYDNQCSLSDFIKIKFWENTDKLIEKMF